MFVKNTVNFIHVPEVYKSQSHRDVSNQVLLPYGLLISTWKSYARPMKICLKDDLLPSILFEKWDFAFVLQ